MSLLIICGIAILLIIWYKRPRKEIKEKQASQNAIELANQYINAFENRESIASLNDLSEDVIEMAVYYWTKCDIASYKCLLESAKEISYMYQGNKYRHDLVEELIRERCK